LQAWRLYAFAGKKIGAALNHFENGHVTKVGSIFKLQSSKFDAVLPTT
jgi:hypothetical protein